MSSLKVVKKIGTKYYSIFILINLFYIDFMMNFKRRYQNMKTFINK